MVFLGEITPRFHFLQITKGHKIYVENATLACEFVLLMHSRNLTCSMLKVYFISNENKREIPIEIRPLMGNRVFGCDDCQIWCPWNRQPSQASRIFLNLNITLITNHSYPYLSG